MDVADIARRIGADRRLVRYALFHGLVPDAKGASRGRGNTRSFSLAEAFAIAVAVRLFAGGLRQPFVKGLVRGLFEKATVLEPIAASAPRGDEVWMLEIADGRNVRIRRGRTGLPLDDPGWTRLETGRPVAGAYRPGVVTSVDLADLVRRLHEP
jgi:hypothetical protein